MVVTPVDVLVLKNLTSQVRKLKSGKVPRWPSDWTTHLGSSELWVHMIFQGPSPCQLVCTDLISVSTCTLAEGSSPLCMLQEKAGL